MRELLKSIALFLIGAVAVLAYARTVTGRVRASLPKYEFIIHEIVGDGQGAVRIQTIDIRKSGKLIQTIRYPDEDDAPLGSEPGPDVSLEDVDCDGYRDLLVSKFTNVHGDSWHYLYRFDAKRGRFVEYKSFSDLPFVDVNCRTKDVKTYVNNGAAGCMYEMGQYRWSEGELLPVQMETQETTDGEKFYRTIKVWQSGKQRVVSEQTFSLDDCHAPKKDGALK